MTAERRGRVMEAMAERDVDALILGKEANARYVSGARRLWLAGARAFAPGCVLVRETGEVHLLSITDDGVPGDIPVANLYPITWNPVNLLGRLAAIPGLAAARARCTCPPTATPLPKTSRAPICTRPPGPPSGYSRRCARPRA